MNDAESYKIISNEFADFIVGYNGDLSIFQGYPGITTNPIDRRYAVIHIPVENMTVNSIYKYGYESIPKCYGLVSLSDKSSVETVTMNEITNYEYRGQGVLVGIVDTGIDYTHQVFKHADNTSRIMSIWDQTINGQDNTPNNFFYGTEYDTTIINQALKNEDPFAIVPSTDDNGHGTTLAGIAAGSHIPEANFMGLVPDSDLVIVKLKPAKPYLQEFFSIPPDALCYQTNDIMFGVQYLLQVAKNLKRPIAICIGVGTSLGDHSGQGVFGDYLSSISQTTGTALVIAAGNEGNRGHHYYGEINPAIRSVDVELNVGKEETGFTMELWGIAPNLFSIVIHAPNGQLVSAIPPTLGQYKTVQLEYQSTSIIVDNQVKEFATGDQIIIFRFKNPLPGIWKFEVSGKVDLVLKFHIWLPIDNFVTQDTFFINPNPYTIITNPGNTTIPITATAYDEENQSLYYYASKGFSRLGAPKPDLAAPGVNINSPTINNQFIRSSGSSLAAAYTTGVTAMMLEWGILRGNMTNMNSTHIKRVLIRGAKRDPTVAYPNQDWGYGTIDIDTTLYFLTNKLF